MRSDLYRDLFLEEEKHWWHISKRKTVENLLGSKSRENNLLLLDIGCGTGRNMEMLSSFGTVWGLDNSRTALSFCKERGIKNLVLGDAASTGFKDSLFDVVTMLDVLEHTEDNAALGEAYRILKPGGTLIITVPAYGWLWSKWDEVLKHKRRYTKKNLQQRVKENGFKVSLTSYMYSFLVLPALIFRFLKSKKDSYESDFSTNPPILNFLFSILSSLERKLVLRGWVPFGTSLVLICKK